MKTKYLLFGGLVAASSLLSACSDFFDQDSDHVIFADDYELNKSSDTIYSLTVIIPYIFAVFILFEFIYK